jgi:uncharacterized RDD family membrane protein YckC
MSTLDPVRWRAASAELDRALDLSSDERAGYLASLRARDAILAADVERLLAEHRVLDAKGFLSETPTGVPTTGDDPTRGFQTEWRTGTAGASLPDGTRVGPYRIVRTLGRGGMGTVYEADEMDSGRRVALKVLEERLNDERERQRFDREGRLAASINHPHCVFVFAASEIDGRPAIAMELMQGTLADRLKAHGPLPVRAAVDVTLQLLSGLQAASALGILHRDIKPSNCFIDADGVVKIGDFGISRSLRPTEETALSTRTKFAATPAYASPEQLRGAALDTRADIYSLGATLYELLTGHWPFERPDLMALLMAVANDAPPAPNALVPAVPKGLSQVVLRCLAKQPHQRVADYDALTAALDPYSSTAPSPATLGRRFAAGFIDQIVLMVLNSPLALWFGFLAQIDRSVLLHQTLLFFSVHFLYYALTESIWAATIGKALVGLKLANPYGRPRRILRTIARAALFSLLWITVNLFWLLLGPADPRELVQGMSRPSSALAFVLQWMLVAALFSSARRRNGYAGWHDLATGLRVVERRALVSAGRRSTTSEPLAPPPKAIASRGPFHVIDSEVPGMPAGWCSGFDERLRRAVWIRDAPPGTPPIAAARIAVSRPTRLRWLAGRRHQNEAWDVFEAVPGRPLGRACQDRVSWAHARWWLRDLARECAAQTPDDQPLPRADRVWILDTGGAKLLDDPVADRSTPAGPGPQASCAPLLLDVARAASADSLPPWPLGANRFVDALRADPPPDNAAIVAMLESLTDQRAAITRGWRALSIVTLAAAPVTLSAFMVLGMAILVPNLARIPDDVFAAGDALSQLERSGRDRPSLAPPDREALEVVLATKYRHVLTDARIYSPQFLYMGIQFDRTVKHVLRRQPTGDEARRADAYPIVRALAKQRNPIDDSPLPLAAMSLGSIAGLLAVVALFALVFAVAFRGGLMRILGLEIVTADGRPASRLRVLARTAVTWAPVIAFALVALSRGALGIRLTDRDDVVVASGLALLPTLVGAVIATLRPQRGIQDRLAGTWIVPR